MLSVFLVNKETTVRACRQQEKTTVETFKGLSGHENSPNYNARQIIRVMSSFISKMFHVQCWYLAFI